MKITLVRHTEIDEDYIGCYNGHNSIGLSKRGHKQAETLSKKLSSFNFDAVFCSDLFRAKETAKHFCFVKDILYTNRLREKSWGKHEGLSFDEIVSGGEIEYINFLQWIKDLDGEPYEEYIKRVEDFFMEYLPSLKKEKILIVTHAGVIRSFMSIIQKTTLEEAFSKKVGHGSYIVYNTKNGDFIYEDI
jgi:broad specificity phosphatase PhoE